MALRPLLSLPAAIPIDRPPGQPAFQPMRKPPQARQRQRLRGQYQPLTAALAHPGGLMRLRDDPSNIAPDRAIVFEIAGSIERFYKAAAKIPGLEFITEEDYSFEPDDDFVMLDEERLPDADRDVVGRVYLAMPTEGALRDIIRLYNTWDEGRPLPHGFTPWRDLFLSLKTMRPWGPIDRVPDDAIALWMDEIASADVTEVRVEAELFYKSSQNARDRALAEVRAAAIELGGEVITSAVVPAIGYHAVLLRLPPNGIRHLIDRDEVRLVLADQIMFLRPQASVKSPTVEVAPVGGREVPPLAARIGATPIAAMIDGFPVQNHRLLVNRLTIDDADQLEARAVLAKRQHGTAIASLILHGDLNGRGDALMRPLHVHPILFAGADDIEERTAPDTLLVDTIYRAVVRIKDPAAPGGPSAPDVFLINLSFGDRRRGFAGPMSPLGKLLDYLAHKYNVLFLVSGGNITDDITLPGYNSMRELEGEEAGVVAQVFLAYARDRQAHRTLLAPSEALNPLTIAAAHDDHVPPGFPHNNSIAPFASSGFPNASSALGLGHRRVIKPDLMLPGGKERLHFSSSHPLVLRLRPAQGYGLRAAAPDPNNRGDLTRRALLCGTSVATALATRAAHQIFDSMMDVDGGSNLGDVPAAYWPVVVKALLTHSARWPSTANAIGDVFGPADPHRHAERADNIARLIGYGIPDIDRVLDCSPSQATLLGYGEISPQLAHEYRVPLPECLERVTDPRSIVLTLAWFSPVSPAHLDYRRAQLLIDAPSHRQAIGTRRLVGKQPSDYASKRGSLVHEVYSGEEAVVFIDDGHLVMRVWCRERPSTLRLTEPIRYALAITIEAGVPLPVYDQVRTRLRPRIQPQP